MSNTAIKQDLRQVVSNEIKLILSNRKEKNAKYSQNEYAKELGISESAMSNVMNPDKWQSVSEQTWTMLSSKVLNNYAADGAYPTQNYRKVWESFEEARAEKVLNFFMGYTGAGKTTACREILRKEPNAYYVLCKSTFGPLQMVRETCKVMGITPVGTRAELEDALIDKLVSTPGAVLIFDSCGKLLKDAAWQWLGDIAEVTEHKCGMLVLGLGKCFELINGRCLRDTRGFRELRRRIYSVRHAVEFAKCTDECIAIMERQGLDKARQNIIMAMIKRGSITCFGSLSNEIRKLAKMKL